MFIGYVNGNVQQNYFQIYVYFRYTSAKLFFPCMLNN